LSGGEKRRVAIAGVLAMDPEVLILDEPTAGLDPKGHNDVLEMIQNIRRSRELTIILVSHNMDDIARLADHVLVMEDGALVMEGSPKSIFAQEEKLRDLGLAVPSATALMQRLARQGYPVRTDILTAAEAEEEIIRIFG